MTTPAKSVAYAKPAKRKRAAKVGKATQAVKAQAEAQNGKLTPRAVRYQIALGKMVLANGKPPDPPEEWSKVKKRRMQRCIDAAHLFLKGQDHDEIARWQGLRLRRAGEPKKADSVTKQRITQLVERGVKFFLDRQFVAPPQ